MRQPRDDELAAFHAVTFQDGRFPATVQDRFGQAGQTGQTRRDGRRPWGRLGTTTDSGAVSARSRSSYSSSATTTTTGDAVAFVVVVVVDDQVVASAAAAADDAAATDGRSYFAGRELVRRR